MFEDLRYYDYMQFCSHFVNGYAAGFVSNSKWRCITGGVCDGILIGVTLEILRCLQAVTIFPMVRESGIFCF